MMPDRRDFISMLAAAAGATALTGPTSAVALSVSLKDRRISYADALVIETGLPTDAAFVRGVAATQTHRFWTSSEGYFDLVARFAGHQGRPILALTNPANAILIEQALRDSGGRLVERRSLRTPAQYDQSAWAYTVGSHLVHGTLTDHPHSHDGHLVAAIVAHL